MTKRSQDRMINHCFRIVCLMMITFTSYSQNIKQIEAVLITSHATNLQLPVPDTFEITSHFVLDQQSSITWKQKNGQKVDIYTITSVEGNWTNINNNGTITYQVIGYELPGKVTITRSSSGISLVVDFTQTDPKAFKYEFAISSLTIQNQP